MPNSLVLDRVLHALADPSRRAMLERLERGPASVSELAAPLAMSLPSVLQHLQLLQAAGLVSSEKVGRVRTCRLEPAALEPLDAWLETRKAAWTGRFDRLERSLAVTATATEGQS